MDARTLVPTSEQQEIVDFISEEKGNLLVNALAGCVALGTNVKIRRGNDPTVRTRPIERLLHLRKPEVTTYVSCNVNGFASYQPIIGCTYSGIKPVLRMETSIGEVIATPDHEIMTEHGWIPLCNVKIKDQVIARTPANIGRKQGRVTVYSVQHHPYAYQHNIGEYGNYKRIHRARLALEAKMNNITLEKMILIVRHDPYKAAELKYLDPCIEVHHINEDPTDDRLDNLIALTSEEHRQIHQMHLTHTRLGTANVIALTSAGTRYTYDIMMCSPNHNFLANGHVVHNCGKTTTLDMIQSASPTLPVLCLAFNKSVADEASKRFPSTTTVRTFNGLGHRVWGKSVSKLTLDPKKTQLLLKEEIDGLKGEDRKAAREAYWEVYNGTAMAKALGYIPSGKFPNAKRLISREALHAVLEEKPSPFTASLIDSILVSSIKASYEGLIDYNDQIYMPALFGGTFPRFPLVLVDEAQDLNPTNHEMLKKLVKGRLAAVGDPWQSIYGFRGAVSNGMGILKQTHSMDEKTISLSFRCPQAVVEAARWRVPNFKWIKEGGLVVRLNHLSARDIPDRATIICRNNAPLFKLAFGLLSSKRSVQVAGSEIGPKLTRIMQKLGDGETSRGKLLGLIEDWREAKLEASNSPATINDMAECMRVFANFGDSLAQAVAYVEHLFKQQGTIKLMTGHKAKGTEHDIVYHLDPWLIGDEEQELNLRYVITTRSAREYYEITSKGLRW